MYGTESRAIPLKISGLKDAAAEAIGEPQSCPTIKEVSSPRVWTTPTQSPAKQTTRYSFIAFGA